MNHNRNKASSSYPILFGEVLIRPLTAGDAPALLQLYNVRRKESMRTFRALGGETTDLAACEKVVAEAGKTTVDLVAVDSEGNFVGWCFVWWLDKPENVFGLLVADRMQGRGLGRKLSELVLAEMDSRAVPLVHLTVVTDNERAIHLYHSLGFETTGSTRGEDGLDYYRMQRKVPS
jgi:ribosomal protein S18 acetylase RimI-like enzyme